MNERIRKMREQIERRGGVVSISEKLPDEIAERFLREILDCPDCGGRSRAPNRPVKEPRRSH